MSAFGNRASFREKTRERAANFVEFRCTARAEFDRRALHALGNTHDVGTVCGVVSVAFGGENARCQRLDFAQIFVRKRANVTGTAANFVEFRCTARALPCRIRPARA